MNTPNLPMIIPQRHAWNNDTIRLIGCVMNEYEKYKDLIDFFEYKKPSWDEVDNFLKFYKNMCLEKREKFNSETPKHTRFILMNSYVSRFFRDYRKATERQKEILIENMLYFISLDNFDYDYRETIINVQGFLEFCKQDKLIINKTWSKLIEKMPCETSFQLGRLKLR